MIFLLIALTCGVSRADLNEVYARAQLNIGSEGRVLRLPAPLQEQVQAYLAKVFDDVRLPTETTRPAPKMILIRPANPQVLACVMATDSSTIYWNESVLRRSSTVDIDRFIMAHELRHFDGENFRILDRRAAEYDADIAAISKRLFRVGLRNPDGTMQAARIHVDTFLKWLRSEDGAMENYIDRGALHTGVTFAFAQQRNQRAFPERVTARPPLGALKRHLWWELFREFKAFALRDLREFFRFSWLKSEKPAVLAKVRTIRARLDGDHLAALTELDQQRRAWADRTDQSPSERTADRDALGADFNYTIKKLNESLGATTSAADLAARIDAGAALSPTLFRDWTDVVREVNELNSRPRHFEFAPADASDAMLASVVGSLPRPDGYFQTIVASRFMTACLAQSNFDLADRPLAAALMALVDGEIHHRMKSALVPLPRVVTAYRAAFRTAVAKVPATEMARALIGVLRARPSHFRRASISGVARFLRHADFEFWSPEFKGALLEQIGNEPEYARLRFELEAGDDPLTYLAELSQHHPEDFLEVYAGLRADTTKPNEVERLRKIWWAFIESPARTTYLAHADRLLFEDPDVQNLLASYRFLQTAAREARIERVGLAFGTWIRRDWRTFIAGWAKDGFAAYSPLVRLTNWSEFFKDFGIDDFNHLFVRFPELVIKDDQDYGPLREAVAQRLLELVRANSSRSTLETAVLGLNLLSTTSPAGQELLEEILAVLNRDHSAAGTLLLLHSLRSIHLINFTDHRAFVEMYATALARVLSPQGDFHAVPRETLRPELRIIKRGFDPVTANQILERLAELYRADFELKKEFSVDVHDNATVHNPDRSIWVALNQTLTPPERTRLARELSGGRAFTPVLTWWVQRALYIIGWVTPFNEVEAEVRSVFRGLNVTKRLEYLERPSGLEPGDSDWLELSRREKLARMPRPAGRARAADFGRALNQLVARTQRDVPVNILERRRVGTLVEDAHVWIELARSMSQGEVENLMDVLRSDVHHLRPDLRAELVHRLSKSKIHVRGAAVEGYLRRRFGRLTPFERAGVFLSLLAGKHNLLEEPSFRRQVFNNVREQMPTPEIKSVFLDLWGAGLRALPRSLRPLVPSVVLSESGTVGSPEQALVTLLAHMGPLEQKFGQNLALSNLPERFRAELRKLWDQAQSLSWWNAQEMMKIQKPGLIRAGYQLVRVLNSGSTAAYLEIEHRETGRRLVTPVYRDGVEQAVQVGAAQLRAFAKSLRRRSARRYGFLPLLVEDSILTMRDELDADHKERMSGQMAEAYRRAAPRLGWTVRADGVLDNGRLTFASPAFVAIDAGGGETVSAQEPADGIPLRLVKDRDPALYLEITRALLHLEDEVQRDPTAPVDKDRMPGQYIVSMAERRVYLLDHGQARMLSSAVHAKFAEFTRRGFAADVDAMSKMLKELTGLSPRPLSLGTSVRGADLGLRPLTFLSEVSPKFLRLPETDERRQKFFELLHGVRAQLRLLQWEATDGLGDLSDHVTEQVYAESNSKLLISREVLARAARRISEGWRALTEILIPEGFRMNQAYRSGALKEWCEDKLWPTQTKSTEPEETKQEL